jgi:hypothetical protein
MYNNYQQQTPNYSSYMANRPVYQVAPTIKGRPVASIEEARASIIDFDGSIFYFPDLANKRIYTKQINLDGTAILNVYELKLTPIEQENYITREEFEAFINSLQLPPSAPVEVP